MRVAKEIVMRNLKSAVGPEDIRGVRWGIRGGYYLSPWLRDLQSCRELLDFFDEFIGEPLVPHCMFSNVPQVGLLLGNILVKTLCYCGFTK